MADRWSVYECRNGHLLSEGALYRGCCYECGGAVNGPFEVVRAVGARTSDPDTSKQAALAHEPRRGSQRALALAYIREAGPHGRTAFEVEAATRLAGIWKRISELKQGGHIVEQGTRRNANGAEGAVFIAERFAAPGSVVVPAMYDPSED